MPAWGWDAKIVISGHVFGPEPEHANGEMTGPADEEMISALRRAWFNEDADGDMVMVLPEGWSFTDPVMWVQEYRAEEDGDWTSLEA